MPDINQFLANAEKLVQQGQLQAAVEECLAAWRQDQLKVAQALKQARYSSALVSECERLLQKGQTGSEFVEFLASLYAELGYAGRLPGSLRLLFDLFFAEGQFLKAADVLQGMADMGARDTESLQRLQRLNGKIDPRRWQALAGRFQTAAPAAPSPRAGPAAAPTPPAAAEVSEEESNVLADLMLQTEIFLQYGMKPRARERLERIQKLFPGEEQRNEKLRSLFTGAGLQPGAAASPGAVPAAAAEAAFEDVSVDIARVSDITRNIYRQGTVKSVLFAAVNDVGRNWRASKCVASLCTPGKTPSAVLEYCAPGTKQSEVLSLVKLISGSLQLVGDGNPQSFEDAEASPKLASLAPVVKLLGIRSLLVLPLIEAEQIQGVLLLEQCDHRRRWRPNDVAALKNIAEQVAMATTHVKLRTLMKSLAVTDERTGMLHRSSYLDCLLTEAARAQKQNGRWSLLLMQLGRANQLVREHGEEAVRHFMDDVGQAVVAHLRPSDVAIRYDHTTLALVLPDTKGQDVFLVVEKMRKISGGLRVSDKPAPPLTCGIAEALLDGDTDAVDTVTELINRAEEALDTAHKEGGNTGKLLEPPFSVAA